MRTLVLNSTNLSAADTTNSLYIYKFPNSLLLKEEKIAFSSMKIYYSWRNITSSYNNNSFSYKWIDGNTYTVSMVDGFYLISDINSYLQSVMITNGHYLINDESNFEYYLEVISNSSTYAINLRSYPVPTSLPSNWSSPSGFTFPSGSAKTPQFVIPSTSIQDVFGVNSGTYPSVVQSSNYVKSSDFTPQVSPIQSLFITCNLINNSYAYPSNILTSFTANDTYGALLDIQPYALVFNDIQDGYYTDIQLRFVDQNFQPVSIVDTNLVILLVIKNKDE